MFIEIFVFINNITNPIKIVINDHFEITRKVKFQQNFMILFLKESTVAKFATV